MCLYGPPGTGKTAFGHYLAECIDKPLLVKKSSDILSPYVGGSELNIAEMFLEAQAEDAVLLLDEADSFLRNRKNAERSWEVSQVNELLTQMEDFTGVFICSTNLLEELDDASLRRFDLKIKFDYLDVKRTMTLFYNIINDKKIKAAQKTLYKKELSRLKTLTPGDFSTVLRKCRFSNKNLDPETLIKELRYEVRLKETKGKTGRIGFLSEH